MNKKILVFLICIGIMSSNVFVFGENTSSFEMMDKEKTKIITKVEETGEENEENPPIDEKTEEELEIERLNNLKSLKKPVIKKIYPEASRIVIKWKKVKDAGYYKIYRGTNKKWKGIKKTKKRWCIVQGINKRKTYYCVKAYLKKPNGKTINSSYSKIKSCYNNVKFGQAMAGERGITGNKAGNQSGIELKISEWHYDGNSSGHFHWTFVVRCKDANKGRIVAKTVRDACKNKHVGYDMKKGDRITLWKEAKKKNWNVSKITRNCETSCTRLACVGLAAAGLTKFPKDIDSYDLKREASKFKKDLKILTSKKYLTSCKYLRKGDILCCGPHHTVIVV